jgi:hypothetical protein
MTNSASPMDHKNRPNWWATASKSMLAEITDHLQSHDDPLADLSFWAGFLANSKMLTGFEQTDIEFFLVKSLATADVRGIGSRPYNDQHRAIWALLDAHYGWSKDEAWLAEIFELARKGTPGGEFAAVASLSKIKASLKAIQFGVPLASGPATKTGRNASAAKDQEPEPPTRIEMFWEAKKQARLKAEAGSDEGGLSKIMLVGAGLVAIVVLSVIWFWFRG